MEVAVGFKAARGLMFRRHPKPLIFPLKKETRLGAAIHSFFVFFKFDVLFLDAQKRIVDKRTVKPFRLVIPSAPAKYIVELPAGSRYKIGEKFKDQNTPLP